MKTPARLRGYIFLVSIIAMAVLLILGVTSIRLGLTNLQQVTRDRTNAESIALAQAAASMAEAYIRSYTPTANSFYYPLGGSATSPILIPQLTNYGTAYAVVDRHTHRKNATKHFYTITGYGTSRQGGITRKVVIQWGPTDFSRYGYFEDTGLGNNWWVSDISEFDGPFHTNGTLQIDWKENPTKKIFHGIVESSQNSVNWLKQGSSRNASPKIEKNQLGVTVRDDWEKIFEGGQSSLKLGADRIDFPTNSSTQRAAAWGAPDSFPSTADVYLREGGGIYINSGNRNCEVEFSVPNSGTQMITIQHEIYDQTSRKWKSKTTEISIDVATSLTSVRTKIGSGSFSESVLGPALNGVLFSTGNINSLKGTIANNHVVNDSIANANAWTVATDFSAGKDVTITENIVYESPLDLSKSPHDPANLPTGVFGLVADQILISSNCPSDLTISGAYMAVSNSSGGSIRVKDIDARQLKGDLWIRGGTIVKTAAILGQYNPSAGATVYGYNEHYSYDPRMAEGPLNAFPETKQFGILTWQCF